MIANLFLRVSYVQQQDTDFTDMLTLDCIWALAIVIFLIVFFAVFFYLWTYGFGLKGVKILYWTRRRNKLRLLIDIINESDVSKEGDTSELLKKAELRLHDVDMHINSITCAILMKSCKRAARYAKKHGVTFDKDYASGLQGYTVVGEADNEAHANAMIMAMTAETPLKDSEIKAICDKCISEFPKKHPEYAETGVAEGRRIKVHIKSKRSERNE